MTASTAAAGETEARVAGRPHPEAGIVAAARSSDGTSVKLCVTNVYNSSGSELVDLETTSTIGDLKRLLQETFPSRPAPHQMRLIFRGKQCEETQQLGHVLRGLDLSGQHNMHLIVSPSIDRNAVDGSSTTANVERKSAAPPLPQQPPLQQRLPTSDGSAHDASAGGAPPPPAVASNGRPERVQLSQVQLGQLQRQYQQALRENEKALDEHRQRFNFLSAQSRALTQRQHYQHRTPTATLPSVPLPPQQQHLQHTEVATRAATRALGGNMPGPVAGGGVRDVTGPPPLGHIPAAGLGEDGETGRANLVDPPANAPDIGREARGWFKMIFQCMGVFLVFGIDADGWLLASLALGGLVAFLFRTGLLKEMLGSGREGGGLWKMLYTGATVVTEGDGVLMDARYFLSAFVFSVFPKWQPVRSPEAIAAEAAAQAEALAQREAATAAHRERARQAVQDAPASTTGDRDCQATNATPAEQGAEAEDGAADAATMPVAQGAEAATAISQTTDASPAEEEAEVDPPALD